MTKYILTRFTETLELLPSTNTGPTISLINHHPAHKLVEF